MKKLLAGLFVLSFLAIGTQAHASVLSDALLKIDNLQKEISLLREKLGAFALGSEPGEDPSGCPLGSDSCDDIVTVVAPVTTVTDLTPRISMWEGKVNQHIDIDSKMWNTDPDGRSGASIDKLTYCKKWYPNTTKVEEYKSETIKAWHGAGNVGDYSNTRMSYKCVEEKVLQTTSIKVLSPNGGEIYKAGDKVTVKWKTESIGSNENVLIILDSVLDTANENDGYNMSGSYGTVNDGSETYILNPKIITGTYKIRVLYKINSSVFDESDYYFTINSAVVAPVTTVTDLTPRISMWEGKVNQHIDIDSKMWNTDPDGRSGASIDKLTYCKKWYPNTTKVEEYKSETIKAWHGAGNVGDYSNTRMSYKCVEEKIKIEPTIISCSSNVLTKKLEIGSTGTEVIYLQNILISLGYLSKDTKIDGKYSDAVRFAVISFQKENGLVMDGVLGLNTRNLLNTQWKTKCSDTKTPSITVLSPKAKDVYNEGDVARVKWTTLNMPKNDYRIHLVFNYLDELKDEYKQSVLITKAEDKGYYDYKLPMFSQYKSSTYPLPGKKYEFTAYVFDPLSGLNSALAVGTSSNGSNDNFFTIKNKDTIITKNNSDINPNTTPTIPTRTLKVGVKGDDVKELQEFLGLNPDGSFGKNTKAKVVEWQKSNGLKADGAFGKASRALAGY